MSVQTVQDPNVSISGFGTAGDGSLGDGSDASYITQNAPNSQLSVVFPPPSLDPADRMVYMYLWVRCATFVMFGGSPVLHTGSLGGHELPHFAIPQTENFVTYAVAQVMSPETPSAGVTWVQNAQEGYGQIPASLSEAYLDYGYLVQPTLTVNAPSDLVETTNIPTVQWTPILDPDSSGQTHYEVKIFDLATATGGGFDPDTTAPVMESGEQTSAAGSWEGDASLPNGDHRAYVQVAQEASGQHWSDWEFSAFEVDVPVPAVPIVAVMGEDARIAIDLADPGGGEGSSDLIQVQRSLDSGATWENIRTTRGGGLVEPFTEELTPAGFKQAILGLEPSLYWALDADDGVTDLSENGRHGSGSGGIIIGGANGLTSVPGDSATDFDGVNDYISSSYSPYAEESDRTFLCLCSRDTEAAHHTIASGTNMLGLFLRSVLPATVQWQPGSSGSTIQWNDAFPGTNIPTALALTYADATLESELFVNGVSLGLMSAGQDYVTSPGTFQVGAFDGALSPLDGKLSHVAVFERILTPAEISAFSEWATTGLRTYW